VLKNTDMPLSAAGKEVAPELSVERYLQGFNYFTKPTVEKFVRFTAAAPSGQSTRTWHMD